VLFSAIPPALYAWARLTGSLPDPDVWQQQGGNHGPWWAAPQGLIIYLCDMLLLVLAALTLVGSLALVIVRRRARFVLVGLLVVAFQLTSVFGHMWLLFWTID
jgi:hypothetical protein